MTDGMAEVSSMSDSGSSDRERQGLILSKTGIFIEINRTIALALVAQLFQNGGGYADSCPPPKVPN